MPITAITIENFKGIEGPVRIDLKPITLLFGPNSAGKSTVLHALQYAYEIFCNRNFSPDRTEVGGEQIDLGGFSKFVHKHDLSREVSLTLHFSSDDEIPDYGTSILDSFLEESVDDKKLWDASIERISEIKDGWVKVSTKWSHDSNKAFLSHYSVGLNDELFAQASVSSPDARPVLDFLGTTHLLLSYGNDPDLDGEFAERQSKRKGGLQDADVLALGASFLFPQLRPMLGMYAGARFLEEATRKEELPEKEVEKKLKSILPLLTDNADVFFNDSIGTGALPSWGQSLPLVLPSSEDEEVTEVQKILNVLFLSSLIVGPGELIRDLLLKTRYLGPIREIPQRHFTPQITKDFKRVASGLAAWDLLGTEQALRESVNEWLDDELDIQYLVEVRDATPIDKEIFYPNLKDVMQDMDLDEWSLEQVAEKLFDRHDQRTEVVLYDEMNEVDVDACDVGVGISQVLPVITEVLNSRGGRLLTIEQPELHIHPKLQVELADLFISQIKSTDDDGEITGRNPDCCFLIETHSEHIMLRLMKRMRQTAEGESEGECLELTDEQLAVHYVQSTDDGTELVHLELNDAGEFLVPWPEGFFDERAKELF